MSAISTAVGTDRLGRISGYQILKGIFNASIVNLPQQIAILAEGNTANQNTMPEAPVELLSATQAGQLFGFGSPVHQIMRILRPVSGEGVGSIPVVAVAQKAAVGATATEIEWTITGTATKSGTHYLIINGRDSLDGKTYAVNIVKGDTPTIIAGKFRDVINAVSGCPFGATVALGVVTATTKWAGLTSADATLTVDTGTDLLGVNYANTDTTAGTGTPNLADSLAQFEDTWFTIVINSYGAPQFEALEAFNGRPDGVPTPTGRWAPTVFKPFVALFGSTLDDSTALAAITNATDRVAQSTNVLCPAPLSAGMPLEAAANAALLQAATAQNTPHLDILGLTYPDMPAPQGGLIGDMADPVIRDFLVKRGCSTVMLVKGLYEVQDFVTTYHPADETPLQFSYVRNLNLDWNVKDAYTVLEKLFVRGHVIVPDNQVASASNVIKPAEWKAKIYELVDDLGDLALLSDTAFSKASVNVQIDPANPNRFNTTFNMKRTGVARIESTTVTVGF